MILTPFELAPLGSICELNPRLTKESRPADTDLVSFIPMAAVDEESASISAAEIRAYSAVKKGFTPFRDNDVLFAKITPCMENGKVALAAGLQGGIGFGSTEFHVLRASARVLPEWLRYYVLRPSFRSQAKRRMSGAVGQQRVPAEFLSKSLIPIPPVDEQRRLVELLSRAENIVRMRREAEQKAKEIIPALFLDMFGYGSSERDESLRYCVRTANEEQTYLNDLHRSATVSLSECCLNHDGIQCGPFGTQLAKSEFRIAGVPLWGIKHVNSGFTLQTIEYLDDSKAEELSRYSLLPDDVVMTRKGTVGNCALYPKAFKAGVMHSDLLRIRVDRNKCNPSFLCDQLHYSPKVSSQIARDASSGAVMPGINVGRLKELRVNLPRLQLQDEYCERVTALRKLSSLQREARRKSERIYQALLVGVFVQ